MCATTTTACRCWPSTSRSTSSTPSSSATKRSPPARAAPWRPSSPTLCTRWVHACKVDGSFSWVLTHVHERWSRGGPVLMHVAGCFSCLSPLAPWWLTVCCIVGFVVTLRIEGGGGICCCHCPAHKYSGVVLGSTPFPCGCLAGFFFFFFSTKHLQAKVRERENEQIYCIPSQSVLSTSVSATKPVDTVCSGHLSMSDIDNLFTKAREFKCQSYPAGVHAVYRTKPPLHSCLDF